MTAALGAAAALLAWLAAWPLDRPRWRRTNFRGRTVTLLLGVVAWLVLLAGSRAVAAAVAVGVAGLAGLYDDLRGDASRKGFAGHLRALASGRLTSGGVKLAAIGAAALVAAWLLPDRDAPLVVDAALVAGCANLANLFDLRPGRALKVGLAAAAPLAGVRPLAAWTAGVCLALLPADLRERGMLGDTGANALGAAVGTAYAWTLGVVGTAVALALVVAATLLSERVSFSRVIDAVPPLRWADRLGRAA